MPDISTIRELRAAIKGAREIRAEIRFGCSERWVRISKTDAVALVRDLGKVATAADAEMYSGTFGSFDGDTLYLG
jgi:hypothetical protein